MNPILKLRKETGVSRRTFTRENGIAYCTQSNIEQGLPLEIKYKTAKRLSKPLKTDAAELQKQYNEWRQNEQTS